MQILNFIPEDYTQRKLLRKANLLCAVLTAAVAVALGIMFAVLTAAEDRLLGQRAEVEQATARAAGGVQQWQQYQADREAVLERARKASRLLNLLPRSRIVAEIVQRLPKGLSLTQLFVAEEASLVVEPELAKGPAAQKAPTKTTPINREQVEMRFRLLGLAPTDVEVAQLIAALSSSGVFDQVELSFSEDQMLQERSLRRFEVLFRLSNDAQRRAIKTAAERTAKAAKEGRL